MTKIRKEYSTDIKEAVIHALKIGRNQAEVARNFGISRQLVNVWNRLYRIRGHVNNKFRQGRPRKTTIRIDKIIKRQSIADPRKTARQITDDLRQNYAVDVHVSTVKRRLVDQGLLGRRPSKKPFISAKNRKARIAFAKIHCNWTTEEWSRVLWSDESKFNLMSSDGVKYIRRPKNERFKVRYQVPTIKHGGGHVMVWGCFSSRGVGPLCRIENTMDRFVYKDILDKHMLPYARRNMPRNWIFQQDNDPKHRSKFLLQYFAQKKINVLEWPSQSPDLNPIEHLWDELKRRVRIRNFSNLGDFFLALQSEWEKIPQNKILKLIESMPRRCETVIQANGYATRY